MDLKIPWCPGFSQDRVNFHQNPGRGKPGGLAQPQPGQTEPGIPYHVPSRWVPVEGQGAARRELTRGSGMCGAGPVWESGSVASAVRVVFSPYLYRCCSCSLLFAVLLNCPYPDSPVSAFFFSFSSARRRGEGRPCGTSLLPAAAETKTHGNSKFSISRA